MAACALLPVPLQEVFDFHLLLHTVELPQSLLMTFLDLKRMLSGPMEHQLKLLVFESNCTSLLQLLHEVSLLAAREGQFHLVNEIG